MIVYTSITKSYLPKARSLAASVKRFHPDWHFVLLFSDTLPFGFSLENEPFDEVLLIENLGIKNWKSWSFGHKVVELCTAVKGPAAEILSSKLGNDKLMYLDPDIVVYSKLTDLENLLDTHEILLTPHLLTSENSREAIVDNEISVLKHGVFNLGFYAARTSGQGLEFIKWWSNRLFSFCEDNIPNGLFTDQKWCDLAPAFFSNLHILRDISCNVATWNVSHRSFNMRNGVYYTSDIPLKFYHFTGYDSGDGESMLQKYAGNNDALLSLWSEYKEMLIANGGADKNLKNWHYSTFANGEHILNVHRFIYKSRLDLQRLFKNPYAVEGDTFYNWYKKYGVKEYQNLIGRPMPKKRLLPKLITKAKKYINR